MSAKSVWAVSLIVAGSLVTGGLGWAAGTDAPATAAPTALDPTVQAQVEAARAAKTAGHYNEAIHLWRPLADSDVPEAEYEMGVAYQYGHGGLCRNATLAGYWLRKAAEQGYAPAQRQMGKLYLYTQPFNTEADHKATAEAWLLKAAGQGDIEAQYQVGQINAMGTVTAEQYATAAHWYEKAAAQGSARAMAELGRLYWAGFGVAKDYDKAFSWYLKAAELDEGEGQRGVAEMYEKGLGVAKNDVKAYIWYRLGASNASSTSSGDAEDVARVAGRLTPAEIAAAEAEVRKFRAIHPGHEWNGAMPVPPVRRDDACEI